MAFCNQCGTPIAEGATICAACAGRAAMPQAQPIHPQPMPQGQGMTDNTAGMLAYFTIIPAIIFLVMEPYSRNRFVRFHAWQCVFFNIAWWVLWFVIRVAGVVTFFIGPLVMLGGFILWIVLVLKANQGQWFRLPVLGDLAEKQANAM